MSPPLCNNISSLMTFPLQQLADMRLQQITKTIQWSNQFPMDKIKSSPTFFFILDQAAVSLKYTVYHNSEEMQSQFLFNTDFNDIWLYKLFLTHFGPNSWKLLQVYLSCSQHLAYYSWVPKTSLPLCSPPYMCPMWQRAQHISMRFNR